VLFSFLEYALSEPFSDLSWALKRLAQTQGTKLDTLRLSSSLQGLPPEAPAPDLMKAVCSRMGFDAPKWLESPDAPYCPLLCFVPTLGWGVVLETRANGDWLVVNPQGKHWLAPEQVKGATAVVQVRTIKVGFGFAALLGARQDGFVGQIYDTLMQFRSVIAEAAIATFFIGMLALVTSLFSMQVYDRVIPTRSEHTLLVLSSGVLLAISLELFMKFSRSRLMDHIVVGMDNRLSRDIFSRLMQLRIDQLPPSVGSLASQIRGYEQVRGFYTASTLFTLIDLPLALVFIVVIMLISHPMVAAVPLVFGLVALAVGLSIRRRIMQQAQEGAALSNMKTGLLVEAVEGMETIKAGSGHWKFLSRWLGVNTETIQNDLKMRHLNESVGHMSASIQQVSYAGIVVAGAWAVMQGHMTIGALIACSIIGGRVLAPIMALPGLLVQHAHAKAAIEGLDRLYRLKVDNQDTDQVLVPERLQGHFELHDVKFSYGDNPPALVVPRLAISPGERVVVLGPIGAGKSTLLRLLSGMYTPTEGRVLVDGLDLSKVHRQVVSQHIGYLQQEHRLFQGTVRENLLVGLPDPGDDAIMQAMRRTGMSGFVAKHPKGLDRAIAEGGKGLSGGQKQLVAFTRLVLTQPDVMLLDEPTATMDDQQERACLAVLNEEAQSGKTMVIVTHKRSVLPLATRIIVVVGNSIVMDGPRDAVLAKMNAPSQGASSQPAAAAAQAALNIGAPSSPAKP
jgi:ATP-binding cassette, subfamily C, bacterial LapB